MPALRAIRGIWGLPVPGPLLEELYIDRFEGRSVPELTLERFPALRRLGIGNAWTTVDELEPLWSSPLAHQLVSVTIEFNRFDHGDVMRLLELPIENMATTAGPWRFELAGAKLAVKYWPPYGRLSTRRIREVIVDVGDVPLPATIAGVVARFAEREPWSPA